MLVGLSLFLLSNLMTLTIGGVVATVGATSFLMTQSTRDSLSKLLLNTLQHQIRSGCQTMKDYFHLMLRSALKETASVARLAPQLQCTNARELMVLIHLRDLLLEQHRGFEQLLTRFGVVGTPRRWAGWQGRSAGSCAACLQALRPSCGHMCPRCTLKFPHCLFCSRQGRPLANLINMNGWSQLVLREIAASSLPAETRDWVDTFLANHSASALEAMEEMRQFLLRFTTRFSPPLTQHPRACDVWSDLFAGALQPAVAKLKQLYSARHREADRRFLDMLAAQRSTSWTAASPAPQGAVAAVLQRAPAEDLDALAATLRLLTSCQDPFQQIDLIVRLLTGSTRCMAAALVQSNADTLLPFLVHLFRRHWPADVGPHSLLYFLADLFAENPGSSFSLIDLNGQQGYCFTTFQYVILALQHEGKLSDATLEDEDL